MDQGLKIKYFQYLQFRLLEWYYDLNSYDIENNLSILKSLKLLFFVTAVKAHNSNENSLLRNVFNTFYALPFGHVESDVYDSIKVNNGTLEFLVIDSEKTVINNGVNISNVEDGLDHIYLNQINDSVLFLSKYYSNLINYTPFELVELSHQWYSWKKNYELAKLKGEGSIEIPIDDIITESKIFELPTFVF